MRCSASLRTPPSSASLRLDLRNTDDAPMFNKRGSRMRRPVALLVLWLALFAAATTRAQQAPSVPASNPPASQARSSASQEPSSTQGKPDVQVWVNTHSGVYHCPNTHWYGATK